MRKSSDSISALHVLTVIALLIVVVLSSYLLLVSRYAPAQTRIANSEQTFLVRIVYTGAWNATYYGWQGSDTLLTHSTLSGNGSSNRTISFEGDVYSGVRFDIIVQKDDASSNNLTLYVSSATNSQTHMNSTTLPFGTAFVGMGEIA